MYHAPGTVARLSNGQNEYNAFSVCVKRWSEEEKSNKFGDTYFKQSPPKKARKRLSVWLSYYLRKQVQNRSRKQIDKVLFSVRRYTAFIVVLAQLAQFINHLKNY